jgi:hypothetical protein
MLYSEFQTECEKLGFKDVEVSTSDFNKIHMVYTYHPAITSKISIALLYCNYGMTTIYDMLQRAEIICAKEQEINKKRFELDKLIQEMEIIKS